MASFLLNNSRISFILFSCLVMSFYSSALAQNYGTATYNPPPYTPSSCYGYEDKGVWIAAASEEIWNGGLACGQNYQVNCVSGTNAGTPHPCYETEGVVVKITDFCPPESCRGTIDLSQEAFAYIADTDSGVINISYQQV